jgi:hypothetical protein
MTATFGSDRDGSRWGRIGRESTEGWSNQVMTDQPGYFGSLNESSKVEHFRNASDSDLNLNTTVRETVPGVRIHLSPPHSLTCRETWLHCSENCGKSPQFCKFCSQAGPEKVSRCTPSPRFRAFFSEGQTPSPVSTTPLGECNAITDR